MSKTEKHRIKDLVESQFHTMEMLAQEINKLNEQGRTSEALRLAKLLKKLSEDSLQIGYAISDNRAA